MWRPSLNSTLVIVCLAGVAGLSAQETTASLEPGTTEEIIEQILDLREKLDLLLQSLPAEMREEVERRWRERQSAAAARSAEYRPQPESTGRLATAIVPAPVLPPPTVPAPEPPAPEEETPFFEPPPAQVPVPAPDQTQPEPTAVVACDNLTVFDTTEDGLVSGADRYWRYLRLWLDDGDGNLESDEIQSLFDLDIREIGVDLKYYNKPDGTDGDIWVDGVIHFDLVGSGSSSGRSGVLVVDADRVARGGEHRLVEESGASLTGYQPVRSDVDLESADGSRTPLLCP